MNAFPRGHAITGLEELSMIISIHLVLIQSFPDHESVRHWKGEITGFMKTLRRWDKGKKGARNYNEGIVFDALNLILSDDRDRELIEAAIESKELNPEAIDWEKSIKSAHEFATLVCNY